MSSTIQLAKGYNPSKLNFPVMVSEKLDGVPSLINIARYKGEGYYTKRSRQDKPLPSITNQVVALTGALLEALPNDFDVSFVAEVTHVVKGMPFKDVSGHVRRQTQNDDLVLNFFDFQMKGYNEDRGFGTRILNMDTILKGLGKSEGWRTIPQLVCRNQDELDCAIRAMQTEHDGWLAEGAVVRSMSELWQPGKRTWGYQKVVVDPTIELKIESYEEATNKHGWSLGMIGRINCFYKDQIIGVGPGKMSHDERRNEWKFSQITPEDNIWITVQYKRDDSYTALRQPTFQHFRPDFDPEDKT